MQIEANLSNGVANESGRSFPKFCLPPFNKIRLVINYVLEFCLFLALVLGLCRFTFRKEVNKEHPKKY